MGWDLAAVATLLAVGNILFGHFVEREPKWRRVAKTFAILGVTAALSRWFGHTGVAVALGIMMIPLLVVHGWWLPHQGVNGWTGEPKARYYELRGWKP